MISGHTYQDIISLDNLYKAWIKFVQAKKSRKDVAEFSLNLSSNIFQLHNDLRNQVYIHAPYTSFYINDPKQRKIHKASVRDRLVHHALYHKLYPEFENIFIFDSYSSRIGKGAHRALNRFRKFIYKVSQNNIKTCWVLKCDIKKFFASIDQNILINILKSYISDLQTMALLSEIIGSFYARYSGIGLPLGNLTSQLFVNIYMNEFDQFMKHTLKAKYYIRYADDFVVMSQDKEWLKEILNDIQIFLYENLDLRLHPGKVSICTINSGVDFLGWVHFFDHRVLRTATKKRMIKRLASNASTQVIASYRGLLGHGNAQKLIKRYLAGHIKA